MSIGRCFMLPISVFIIHYYFDSVCCSCVFLFIALESFCQRFFLEVFEISA